MSTTQSHYQTLESVDEWQSAIDVLYRVYNETTPGDRVVYEATKQWSLVLERVQLGLFVVLTDVTLFTLSHKDELLAQHSGRYAGFGPTILKSRYGVSNLLKNLIKDLPELGIDIHKPGKVIKMN